MSASSEVTAAFRHRKLPNDGALPGTTHQRRTVRNLDAIRSQLTDRDAAVLQAIWGHRVLTARQVQALAFGELPPTSGLRFAQVNLKKLRELWVIGVSAQRRHGARPGRPELIYYVDAVGDRLLRADVPDRVRYQWKEPSLHYLQHQLAIADVHAELVKAQHRGLLELVCCQLEPASWRRFFRLGTVVKLKPDLYVETTAEPGSAYLDGFFIEVDLGTESIPTLIRKCHDYQTYWQSGAEQDDDGNGFPLIMWHLSHKDAAVAERRRKQLLAAIQKDRKLDPELFRITSPDNHINLIQKGGDL
ncbi:replication-relaxation family protein [Nocardia sp. CA-135953]|uniref:replication-relaxation family protein n=1 Tax=Nocardia sp. CA-135953 TaxID=3239978 RepID=UPI003D981BA9